MQQQMSPWQAIPCPFLFPSIIALFCFLLLLKEKFVLFVCNLQFKLDMVFVLLAEDLM